MSKTEKRVGALERVKTVILSILTGGLYLAVKMHQDEQEAKKKKE